MKTISVSSAPRVLCTHLLQYTCNMYAFDLYMLNVIYYFFNLDVDLYCWNCLFQLPLSVRMTLNATSSV